MLPTSLLKNKCACWLTLLCAIFFICNSCSSAPDKLQKEIIQGAWKGTLTYKQIREFKEYAPLLEDSLTKRVDSTIVINNVFLNINKEQARFLGFQHIISSVYFYRWDEDRLIFQKKLPRGEIIRDSSGAISVKALMQPTHADILKLDADSLVMHLNIHENGWEEYTVKLKRQ